ncbi:MAG: hypothetical protein AAF740_08290 [Bacteroidota bacterium]
MRLFTLLLLLSLTACSKRSQCPTYLDSDPKLLFGSKPVQKGISARTNPKETDQYERDIKSGLFYKKKTKRKTKKMFKKRRNKDMGKRNKRKKKHKVTPGSGNG